MDSLTESITRLASQLIERRSVTPDDAGCQEIISGRLAAQGFTVKHLPSAEVQNLWAVRGGGSPVLMFAGHTDVVPSGPVDAWQSDPFTPRLRNGMLFGRGSADMKGSLAAMLLASDRFVNEHPDHHGTLAYLITSDEEGPAVDGTVRVVDHLRSNGIHPDYCVVGEPSSNKRLGDVIRIGRRGSLNGCLRILGVQGHVAYPELTDNPIHAIAPLLEILAGKVWDQGNLQFPPTIFQVSNINSGTGATNVVPGTLEMLFNFRFSTEYTSAELQELFVELLENAHLNYELDWDVSGEPFLTSPGVLIDAACASIEAVQGYPPELSTGGGTSDGRFIAPLGTEVIELGPLNETIHQIDEHVCVADLVRLSDIYLEMIKHLLLADDA